ncbi:MAG: hypothetical protein KJT01_04195, partial [Gemmatimonadetes bacterium]|nr:hypothetical protein [Gemmatimonadota bacterium]
MTTPAVPAAADVVALGPVARRLAPWRRALVAVWGARVGLLAAAGGVGGAAAWHGVLRLLPFGPGWWGAWGAALVVAGGVAAALWMARTGWPSRDEVGGWMGALRPRRGVADAAVWVETGVLPWERGRRTAATRQALEGAGYALITCAEAIDAAASGRETPMMAARVVRQGAPLLDDGVLRGRLRAQAWRWLRVPAAAMVSAAVALWGVSRLEGMPRVEGGVDGGAARRGGTAGVAPLGPWRVTVRPPSYTGRPVRQLGDTGGVTVLAGTVVELQGKGMAPRTAWRQRAEDSAAVPSPPAVTEEAGGWRVRVQATARPQALVVERGVRARLFVVDGVADSLPVVTLESPLRDTVVPAPEGTVPLRASVHDDLGVKRAQFEVIVSAGEGERYTAKVLQVGARTGGGAQALELVASLSLDALGLNPGDVLHVRAVARDAHPLASREPGASETRRLRVARRGERDSLAVEGAPPPPVDTSVLSQRMLLRLATALARQRPRLAPAALRAESGRLARDQARLRQAVGAVVFQRLGGAAEGEHSHFAGDGHEHGVEQVENKLALAEGNDGPVVAVNRPLLEAYNHMWDAGRALELAEPGEALAPMRRALAAIERARAAERVYLRGRPPTVIVDVARVRLAGRERGQTAARTPREALAPVDARRAARLVAAAVLAARDAAAAR